MRELYSAEAEMSVLGSMILSRNACEDVLPILTAQSFYNPAHGLIFSAMKRVTTRGGLDYVTLLSDLERTGKLQEAGGEAYLLQVAEVVPSPSNAKHYASIVAELAGFRNAESLARKVIQTIHDGGKSLEEVLGFGERFSELRGYQEGDLLDWTTISVEGEESGITTGHAELDRVTGVGYVRGQLSVVSAYQKGGKTSWMVDSLRAAAQGGYSAVYATFADLNPSRLKRRALKNECGKGGRPTVELEAVADWEEAVASHADQYGDFGSVQVYDARRHGKDVETFVAKIRGAHRKSKIDVVFCDYAQRIASSQFSAAEKTRCLEYVSGKLDDLAQSLDIAVVVGSQVTKKEGGDWVTQYAVALEQDAGLVIRLRRDEDDPSKGFVEVPFNRFGPEATFEANWNNRHVRYEGLRLVEKKGGKK